MATGTATRRPRSGVDMIIAAVAEANDCVIVTDDERGFAGLPLFNPIGGRAPRQAYIGRAIR